MPAVRRMVLVALLLGLLSSAVAPLAAAEPRDPSIKDVQYVYVAIHIHTDGCSSYLRTGVGPFGEEGSNAYCGGWFTAGHTGGWNGPLPGVFDYFPRSGDAPYDTVVEFRPKSGPYLAGLLPGRGSGDLLLGVENLRGHPWDFTRNPWIDPNRPANTPGGPLHLNVVYDHWLAYDVYVNGYVPAGDRAAP